MNKTPFDNWDEDKQEWYVLDETNNKKYESEFPPLYNSSN
jgi:hypothetical protein